MVAYEQLSNRNNLEELPNWLEHLQSIEGLLSFFEDHAGTVFPHPEGKVWTGARIAAVLYEIIGELPYRKNEQEAVEYSRRVPRVLGPNGENLRVMVRSLLSDYFNRSRNYTERLARNENGLGIVVEDNVRIMIMRGGDFESAMMGESYGGNAGSFDASEIGIHGKYQCCAVNGAVDNKGGIVIWGNFQDFPQEIKRRLNNDLQHFTFQVASITGKGEQIINVSYEGDSIDVLKILIRTANRFNIKKFRGLKIEPMHIKDPN